MKTLFILTLTILLAVLLLATPSRADKGGCNPNHPCPTPTATPTPGECDPVIGCP